MYTRVFFSPLLANSIGADGAQDLICDRVAILFLPRNIVKPFSSLPLPHNSKVNVDGTTESRFRRPDEAQSEEHRGTQMDSGGAQLCANPQDLVHLHQQASPRMEEETEELMVRVRNTLAYNPRY